METYLHTPLANQLHPIHGNKVVTAMKDKTVDHKIIFSKLFSKSH